MSYLLTLSIQRNGLHQLKLEFHQCANIQLRNSNLTILSNDITPADNTERRNILMEHETMNGETVRQEDLHQDLIN